MRKVIALLIISCATFAQKDGFWDKERAFTKEIKLSAGNRNLIKIDALPEGTSEIVYRISLIDENSTISNSLASVLKAIPDPTGISQGTAGAIILTNSVSGDDTCLYGIFTSEKSGTQYLKDGVLSKACYSIKEAVNKDSKLISMKNSTCFENNSNIWFAFENKNWVMSTKIVLEVVAWVDYKASRGWNSETKKELDKIVKAQDVYASLSKKDLFEGEFINLFTSKFKYSEYKALLLSERNAAIYSAKIQALKNTKQMDDFLELKRNAAWDFYKKNEFQKAIDFINEEIIANNWGQAKDYSALGDVYIETKQFTKAKEVYVKATNLDKTELLYQLKLANALVFNDEVSQAKEIHKQFMNNNINTKTSWKDQVKYDIEFYHKKGLDISDFKKIMRILE